MDIAKIVTEGIKAHRACNIFVGGSVEQLAKELFTAQGIEFVLNTHYPGLREFQKLQESKDLKQYGIYVDCGNIELSDENAVCLIGNTNAIVKCSKTEAYRVYTLNGARAYIHASGYSVVRVEKDDGSVVDSNVTDNAVMLW